MMPAQVANPNTLLRRASGGSHLYVVR
jgi:hypothetical protein